MIANPPAAATEPDATRAGIAVAGAARFARASAWVLVVLAGLSTLFNLLRPLSASFVISLLALGNGVIEWRFARRIPTAGAHAFLVLARNQFALGLEVLGYSIWRLATFSAEEILAILEWPQWQPFLELLPPEELQRLVDRLPPLTLLVIGLSGVLTALGCGGVAWYYLSRRKLVAPAAPPSNP